MNTMIPFFESTDPDFKATETVGSFNSANRANSFDSVYTEACENMLQRHSTKMNGGFLTADALSNPAIVSDFRSDMLAPFEESANQLSDAMKARYGEGADDLGNAASLYDQLGKLFDNKIAQFTEEASVGQLLPIKAIDFPIMMKTQVKQSFKDVVNEEITPNVVIKKQIEHKIVYSKQDPKKRWEYPQCFFNDDFKEMMEAGRGTKLKSDAVALPLYNYDIIGELTDAPIPSRERLVFDVKIESVEVAATDTAHAGSVPNVVIALPTPITVNLADGSWVGGKLNLDYTDEEGHTKHLDDCITGMIDWTTYTTTLTAANGKVVAVHFTGRLSNEGNENTVRFAYQREDREFKVAEGFKADSAYTLEELQEHKALLDMDLYTKTYNDLCMLITDMADSDGFDWLDREKAKYDGLDLDPLQWQPMVKKTEFNCDSTIATVALPCEYIAKQLKFKIDRFLIDIADDVKMNNLKFVIYGNPRYISLIDPSVKWVFRSGDRVGGVELDYSYGVMTSGETSVYVVSSKKINPVKNQCLRIIPFAPNGETITFKRYKFSTDIVTAKDSAYRDTERAGGSQTYVWGTSRYADVSIQGIQGEIDFKNADFISL
mgnify:FL=1